MVLTFIRPPASPELSLPRALAEDITIGSGYAIRRT